MTIRIHKTKSHNYGRPAVDPCPPCLYGLNGVCMECGRDMPVLRSKSVSA